MEQFINILLDRLEDKTKTIAKLNDELSQYEQLSTQQSDVDSLKAEVKRLDTENWRLNDELVKYTKQCEALSAECQELRSKAQNTPSAPKAKKVGNHNAVPPSMREEAPALQDAGFLFIKPDEPRMYSYYEDVKEATRATKENYLSIKFAPKNGKLIGGLEVQRAKQRDELIDGKKVFDILDPVTGENTLRYYASDGHMDTILADA